jgi:hypothetical protein
MTTKPYMLQVVQESIGDDKVARPTFGCEFLNWIDDDEYL